MIKFSSRIRQLSPQIGLTLPQSTRPSSSKTIINRHASATLAPTDSQHLSFNLNIARDHTFRSYSTVSEKLKDGPGLKDFLIAGKNLPKADHDVTPTTVPYLTSNQYNGNGRKVFFEIYGCQMNSNDGEVVYSVLNSSGYIKVDSIDQADVVLLVTCSIRDNAEAKVRWFSLVIFAARLLIVLRYRFGIVWSTLRG